MTATITSLLEHLPNFTKERVSTNQAGTDFRTANTKDAETSSQDTIRVAAEVRKLNEDLNFPNVQFERIYPHVYDEKTAIGQVRLDLIKSHREAQLALEAFGHADLDAVSTRLAQIAVIMKNVHKLTEFNRSLGVVVSFIRRATLNASAFEINRAALNSLVNQLNKICLNPMVDLEDAGEIASKLSEEGWHGEHGFSNALLAALFDDLDTDHDANKQAELFEQN